MRDPDINDQPVSVLHESVLHAARARLGALTPLEQTGIGVRGALLSVVAALMAFKVHLGAAPELRAAVIVLAIEALVQGQGFDERAVYAEVLVAGELAPLDRDPIISQV